uniref:Retrotransposon gag domain-containing protein n=1 Tax=Panagrolaimus superbus TaxID=310955 RepID=A0A914Y1D4_9BILA
MSSYEFRIDPFDGNPRKFFRKWIEQLNLSMNAEVIPLSDKNKVGELLFHLKGIAYHSAMLLPNIETITFAELVKHLEKTYPTLTAKRHAQQELHKCYQKKNENVFDFSTRISEAVYCAMDGDALNSIEERLKEEFVNRLLPKLHLHIELLQPLTFKEAVSLSIRYEHYCSQKKLTKKAKRTKERKCAECGNSNHPTKFCRHRKRRKLSELQQPGNDSPNQHPEAFINVTNTSTKTLRKPRVIFDYNSPPTHREEIDPTGDTHPRLNFFPALECPFQWYSEKSQTSTKFGNTQTVKVF